MSVTKARGRDGKLYPTRRVNVAERNRQIIALWVRGLSASDIADLLEVSTGTVYRAVPDELR